MITPRFVLLVLILSFFSPLVLQSHADGEVAIADPEKKPEAVEVDNPSGRAATEITEGVAKYAGQLKHIYNMELRKQSKLEGKIVVSFDIASNGEVIKVRLVSSTFNEPALENRMLAKIKGWKFKKVEQGPPMTVEYPFVFSPQKK